jgi:hypothetical protein
VIIGGATDIDGAIKVLTYLRTYAPYKYGGTWFVSKLGAECHAHRTLALLKRKAAKLGVDTLEYAKISSQ